MPRRSCSRGVTTGVLAVGDFCSLLWAHCVEGGFRWAVGGYVWRARVRVCDAWVGMS